MYVAHKEMSRVAGAKKPQEAQKAKAHWKMKAAKDAGEEYYDPSVKTTSGEETKHKKHSNKQTLKQTNTQTYNQTNNQTNNQTSKTGCVLLFCVGDRFCIAETSWRPVMGAAQRRRERRLRSWYRHEQQTVRMALATFTRQYGPGKRITRCTSRRSSSSSSPSSRSWRRLSSSTECVGYSSSDAEEGTHSANHADLRRAPQVQFLGKVVLSCVVQRQGFGPDSAENLRCSSWTRLWRARRASTTGVCSRQCRKSSLQFLDKVVACPSCFNDRRLLQTVQKTVEFPRGAVPGHDCCLPVVVQGRCLVCSIAENRRSAASCGWWSWSSTSLLRRRCNSRFGVHCCEHAATSSSSLGCANSAENHGVSTVARWRELILSSMF